jgi:hypothetical protein
VANAVGYNRIPCPVPEAPYRIASKQTTPTFGTKPQVELSWSACESPFACCCPCRYLVFRDGKLVGTTTDHTLTDTSPLTVGVDYNYEVYTIDANNAASPNDTCRNFAIITGEPADLTTFLILLLSILVVVVTFVTCAIIVVVYWQWPRLKPKLSNLRAYLRHKFTVTATATTRSAARIPSLEMAEMEDEAPRGSVL